MIDLSSEVEMEIVASGLMGMLALGTWLFFPHDSKGEQSLFEKMSVPYDEMPTPPILIAHARASLDKWDSDVPPCNPASGLAANRQFKGGHYRRHNIQSA